MSTKGLWGVAGPDSGTAARGAESDINRPSSAWAPQRGLRGTISQESGTAARTQFQTGTGTYFELISVNESFTSFSTITLQSFSLLVGSLESYEGLAFVDHPFTESVGVQESYTGFKAGTGTYLELISVSELYLGLPGPVAAAGQGVYGESIGVLDSYIGVKNGRGTYSELVSLGESYVGTPGGAVIPPDPGQLSPEPLRDRIGSSYVADLNKRIGPPAK